ALSLLLHFNFLVMTAEVWHTLLANILNTSITEFIAVILGLLSVFFIMKQNILGYPTGLINVSIYVWLCFKTGLYANMGINVFYFIVSIFGWYQWSRKHAGDEQLRVSRINKIQLIRVLISILVLTLGLWRLLQHFPESSSPFFDAFTTAVFIVAMVLQAYKKLESWLLWILGDIIAIPLFAMNGLVFTGFQYLAFLVLALSGYLSWKKSLVFND
ncbi:MAG: nicotinamide riboside transporter PnuC, partial [Bacteroidales bacterium]